MFVDASALVAIILLEPEADVLADRLALASAPMTSAIAIYETALAVARVAGVDLATALADVHEVLETTGMRVVEIGLAEASAALNAHARFGKGRHPARLNMGDCFAYACSRNRGVPLLFKGEDFALTDVEAA